MNVFYLLGWLCCIFCCFYVLIHELQIGIHMNNFYTSPINWILYQPPSVKYTSSIVTHWIPKNIYDNEEDSNTDINKKSIPAILFSYSHYLEEEEEEEEHQVKKIIIYSHGNAENLLTCYPWMHKISNELRCDVLSYDYSGYGLNPYHEKEQSTEGMNLTLMNVVEYVHDELEYDWSQIYLMGCSLGTGVSIEVASQLRRVKLGGLILLAPFSSIRQVAIDYIGNTLGEYVSERWNNLKQIHKVQCPILCMYGENDELFSPSTHGDLLKNSFRVNEQPYHPSRTLRSDAISFKVLPKTSHCSWKWNVVFQHIKSWWNKQE